MQQKLKDRKEYVAHYVGARQVGWVCSRVGGWVMEQESWTPAAGNWREWRLDT